MALGNARRNRSLAKRSHFRTKRSRFRHWAREYERWTRGIFNQDRLAHRAQLTQEIFDAGPDAVMAFLGAKEASKQLAEARVIFIGDGEVGKTSIIRRLHHEPLQSIEPPTPGMFVRESEVTVGSEEIACIIGTFAVRSFCMARTKRMGKRVLQAVSSVDNLTSIANNVAHLLDRL